MWKRVLILKLYIFSSVFIQSLFATQVEANDSTTPLAAEKLASLQRGAKYFMNFCSGCHSLKRMHYDRMAEDLQIIDKKNPSFGQEQLKKNLIFTQVGTHQRIESALTPQQALLWFGVSPPDLSLISRARSMNWVYNYLLGFYKDKKRPFGVNNYQVNRTAMPDPLTMLRRENRLPHAGFGKNKSINLSNREIENTINHPTWVLEDTLTDLVHFLDYVGEPTRDVRRSCGKKVCVFLLLFVGLAYLLKKQIWRSVYLHSQNDERKD